MLIKPDSGSISFQKENSMRQLVLWKDSGVNTMRVEQIAVFLENKSGRLAEITSVLANNNINIRALSVADTADFGILRLIVDKVDEAKKVLKENSCTVGKTNVVAVEVPDKVGGLAGVLRSGRRQPGLHLGLGVPTNGLFEPRPGNSETHDPVRSGV
jgi:predicted amino acid-binding ACT domain protein